MEKQITYKRKDLVGQVEEFTGEPEEIMVMIKMLELNNREEVKLSISDGSLLIAIESEDLIELEDRDDYED